MKWILHSNRNALVHEYHLVENDQLLLTLKYNPTHRSARIHAGGMHKLFFIESTGSLSSKYLLKNEYSMETGQLSHQPWMGKDGRVLIDSSVFSYRISTGSEARIAVYQGNDPVPTFSCELEAPVEGMLWTGENAVNGNCLLLSLCWYLYAGVANRTLLARAS